MEEPWKRIFQQLFPIEISKFVVILRQPSKPKMSKKIIALVFKKAEERNRASKKNPKKSQQYIRCNC